MQDSNYFLKVLNIARLMQQTGHQKPIWLTEIGVLQSTTPPGVDEMLQAIRLEESVNFVRDRLGNSTRDMSNVAANVQRVYWFSLEDYETPDGLGNFGLFNHNGKLRKAGEVFHRLNTQ